jgi:hypothetical protein
MVAGDSSKILYLTLKMITRLPKFGCEKSKDIQESSLISEYYQNKMHTKAVNSVEKS